MQLHLSIEASLIRSLINFCNLLCIFWECHDPGAHLLNEKFLIWTFVRWEIQFFWAKKLMERWYLLGLFERSLTFQGFGDMIFCTVYQSTMSWISPHFAKQINVVLQIFLPKEPKLIDSEMCKRKTPKETQFS